MKKERFTAYRDTDYMYVSALARAKERGIIGKDGLSRMIDSEAAILAEHGYIPSAKEGLSPGERDRLIDEELSARFDEIEAVLPHFEGETHSIVTPLRYPYDCNNIKMALKCSIRGIGTDGLLFGAGTLTPETVTAMVAGELKEEDVRPCGKSRAEGVPFNMSRALRDAKDAYAASKNPRVIDLLLDRACYADMLEAAETMGVPYLTDYVKLKIDSTNLLTALRVVRMYGDSPVRGSVLEDALLDGGDLDLLSATDGREAIADAVRSDARFGKIASHLTETDSLSELERIIDGVISDFIIESKRVSFGAEVPIGYLLGFELSVKNVRIVMAGKEAQLDGALIRERLRENYV